MIRSLRMGLYEQAPCPLRLLARLEYYTHMQNATFLFAGGLRPQGPPIGRTGGLQTD